MGEVLGQWNETLLATMFDVCYIPLLRQIRDIFGPVYEKEVTKDVKVDAGDDDGVLNTVTVPGYCPLYDYWIDFEKIHFQFDRCFGNVFRRLNAGDFSQSITLIVSFSSLLFSEK